jgi:hypothetical protein
LLSRVLRRFVLLPRGFDLRLALVVSDCDTTRWASSFSMRPNSDDARS